MNLRIFVIVGMIIVSVIAISTIGTMEYQSTYNENCTSDGGKVVGFLKCVRIHEDFALSNPFTIDLEFGKTFQHDDLKIKFYDIEDSRCPLDVSCVWEEKVTAMFMVSNQTHDIGGRISIDSTMDFITPFEITLKEVQPHPISTEKPDYVATLEITKVE